jgi:tRNA threonylcarbamoyladenosine biosynthesis protein TsaE
MKTISVETKNPNETFRLGTQLARYLEEGDILCLFGNLGTGKTTFVKGIGKGLDISDKSVHSPTFISMNMYKGRLPLYHFDLYRLEDERELSLIGYEEFLYGDGVSLIEWADKMKSLLPKDCLKIEFEYTDPTTRSITFQAQGKKYEDLISRHFNKKL